MIRRAPFRRKTRRPVAESRRLAAVLAAVLAAGSAGLAPIACFGATPSAPPPLRPASAAVAVDEPTDAPATIVRRRGRELSLELEHGDRTRRCLVHVGTAVDPDHAAPLVLVFHGAGANGDWQKGYCGLAEDADREGFIAAFPDGTGRLGRWLLTWNAGSCCGYATNRDVDDVAFVRRLLDRLDSELRIDPRRVYAVGLSNGGMMCYRLARELPDRIAAVGVVAGTHLGDPPAEDRRAVPVIHFHGTDDKLVPFEGGSDREWMPTHGFRSARGSAELWARHAGCDPEPATRTLPDSADDGTRVRRRAWGDGRDGSRVVLYEIEGGGHTWPGRVMFAGLEAPVWARRFSVLGRTTEDIDANELLWAFFREHPMPARVDVDEDPARSPAESPRESQSEESSEPRDAR